MYLKNVKIGKPHNSTERSRKRREAICKDKILHNVLKKDKRVCKNTENALNRLKRETDEELREHYRRKQRENNIRDREKMKQMMQNQAIKFSTLQKKEIKNIKWRLRRKNVENIKKLKSDWEREKKELQSSPKDDTLVKENESTESMPLIVTKALWGHMSPSSRTKVKKEWLMKEQKK